MNKELMSFNTKVFTAISCSSNSILYLSLVYAETSFKLDGVRN